MSRRFRVVAICARLGHDPNPEGVCRRCGKPRHSSYAAHHRSRLGKNLRRQKFAAQQRTAMVLKMPPPRTPLKTPTWRKWLARAGLALVAVLMLLLLLFVGSAVEAATPPPTPTIWSEVEQIIGPDLVDKFRIEYVFSCGSDMNECLKEEDDALVLARIALGESPSSPDDQLAIMWNIKLAAYLGYKLAGYYSGYRDLEARWGMPTSIKYEGLCDNGCQFEVVRAGLGLFWPCEMSEYAHLRMMYCPTDNQLVQFNWAYEQAQRIVSAPITDFPMFLRGYDTFRSAHIEGVGRYYWKGGLPTRQMYPRASIWRDESPDDNLFWEYIEKGKCEFLWYDSSDRQVYEHDWFWCEPAQMPDPWEEAKDQRPQRLLARMMEKYPMVYVSQNDAAESRVNDCGPAAGATVLDTYLGTRTRAFDFYPDMKIRGDPYTTGLQLQEWALKRGLQLDSIPLDEDALKEEVQSRPVIGYMPGHWLVVVGYQAGYYLVFDPRYDGPSVVPEEEFDSEVALYFLVPGYSLWEVNR